jgi:hypothetical protein
MVEFDRVKTPNESYMREPPRELPVVDHYDLIVCGGGTSGIPAALAAARRGVRTAVVEKYGFLGGVPVANLNPTWHGRNRVQSNLLDEYANRIVRVGNGPKCDELFQTDAEDVKYLAQEMAIDAGVDLDLHTLIVDSITDGTAVRGIVTESASGRRVMLADRIIDASGGGIVAVRAGAEFLSGSPDGRIQGMSLRVRFGNIEMDRYFDWIARHPELYPNVSSQKLAEIRRRDADGLDYHIAGNLVPLFEKHPEYEHLPVASYFNCSKLHPGELNCNATRIDGLDTTKTENLTRAEIECRRQAFSLLHFLRDQVAGFERAIIVQTAPQIGVRESRCVVGDYILTEDDCRSSASFPDSVCRNDWIVFDLHDPKHYSSKRTDGPVSIPYRCLLPRGLDDVMVVGRAASADHVANSGIRQMRTVFILGQVAGIATQLSLEAGVGPREVPYDRLRTELDREGIQY